VLLKALIRKEYEVVDPHAGIAAVEESVSKNSFLVVMDGERFFGILTPSDVIEHPHQLVVDCISEKHRVNYGDEVESVLDVMKTRQCSILPVFKQDKFVGVVTQADIADYLFEYQRDLEKKVVERTTELIETISQLQHEIAERTQTEKRMKRRLEFEHTISSISSRFVDVSDIDKAINACLADMGRLTRAGRSYVFLFRENEAIMDNTHEWCGPGLKPQKQNLGNLPFAAAPWWMEKLGKEEIIHIKDVSQLPKEADAEKKILERQDIKSLLAFRLKVEGEVTGFIGLDNVMETGQWDKIDFSVLQASVEIIGHALTHKKAQKKLIDYQDQLRLLSSQLTLVEEQERKRIATELHDEVIQAHILLKMKLGELREKMTSEKTVKIVDELRELASGLIKTMRSLTLDLSSPLLYEAGLESAIKEWLNKEIRKKHGLETDFADDGSAKPLAEDIMIHLFRAVKELLINVVKHAHAQKVKVSVEKDIDKIKITVQDDGVGFVISDNIFSSNKTGGFGFFSINERLYQFCGTMAVESEVSKGTRVVLTAPLKRI